MKLDLWIECAKMVNQSELDTFLEGINRGLTAVKKGITEKNRFTVYVEGGETFLLVRRLNSGSGFNNSGNEKRFVTSMPQQV